jgi:F-type H+-transporting ATPase subunit delta
MKISKTAAATARRIFGLCQTNGRTDEAKLRDAARRIAERKPRDFAAVLAGLLKLARLDAARREVTVESATELDAAARSRIEAGLARSHGAGLRFAYRTQPDLIGGLRVRIGDDVLDGSVRGRIDRLASSF